MEIINKKKSARGHMPVKRSINLATVGEKSINPFTAIPAVALVIVLSILFSKFAVLDRFAKVDAMRHEVYLVQRQIDDTLAALDEFGELKERYAHYTYSGFTEQELTRTDRLKIMDLIDRMIMPYIVGGSWSISGNSMVLNLHDQTLEDINQLTQRLLQEELVDYCTVTTARKTPQSKTTEPVVASVTIYFKPGDATIRFVPEEETLEDKIMDIEMVNTLDRRRQEIQSQGLEDDAQGVVR